MIFFLSSTLNHHSLFLRPSLQRCLIKKLPGFCGSFWYKLLSKPHQINIICGCERFIFFSCFSYRRESSGGHMFKCGFFFIFYFWFGFNHLVAMWLFDQYLTYVLFSPPTFRCHHWVYNVVVLSVTSCKLDMSFWQKVWLTDWKEWHILKNNTWGMCTCLWHGNHSVNSTSNNCKISLACD